MTYDRKEQSDAKNRGLVKPRRKFITIYKRRTRQKRLRYERQAQTNRIN